MYGGEGSFFKLFFSLFLHLHYSIGEHGSDDPAYPHSLDGLFLVRTYDQ